MKNNASWRMPIVMYTVTAAFLAVVTVFSCLLNFLSFRSHLAATEANSLYISLSPTISRIEYAMSFGKPLAHFYGMQSLLAEQCERVGHIENLYVLDEGKTLLHTAYPDKEGSYPTLYVNGEYIEEGGRLWYPLPLAGDSTLLLEADIAGLKSAENAYLAGLVRFGLWTAAAALVLALILYLAAGKKGVGMRGYKNRSVAVLVLSQLALGLFTYQGYMAGYRETGATLARISASTVAQDVNGVTSLGIGFDELYGLEDYLKTYTDIIPEFDAVALKPDNHPVMPSELATEVLLGGETRLLVFSLSAKTMNRVSFQYILNTLLLLTTSILLITETQFLITARLKRLAVTAGESARTDATAMMRMTVFALYACINMGLAISPIAASRLYEPALGIDRAFAVGLPITAEMFASLGAILLTSALITKLGIRGTFLLAIGLACAGLIGSAFARGIPVYTAARAAVGFGYGLITILGRTFASQQTEETGRTEVLAQLSGGSIAGLCFGSILGGILSEHLSFETVFLISAAAIAGGCAMIFFIPFAKTQAGKKTAAGLFSILSNPSSLLYLLLLVVPVYACSLFISYVLPLTGSTFALSTSAISGLIMANALLSGYLSPAMTGWCLTRLGIQRGVLLYIAATSAAIAVFAFFPVLPVLVAVVCVLGIADSFGIVILLEGFRRTRGAAAGGPADGMIAATMAGKAGQAVAPTLLLLPSPLGGMGGACFTLAVFAAAGGLFYLFAGRALVRRERALATRE